MRENMTVKNFIMIFQVLSTKLNSSMQTVCMYSSMYMHGRIKILSC